MQMESGVAQTLTSQSFQSLESLQTTIIRLDVAQNGQTSGEAEGQTPHRHDVLAAAIVIGLTAQFVAVIFGLVTNFIPTLLINLVLSSFIGVCVGLISYMLMNDSAF